MTDRPQIQAQSLAMIRQTMMDTRKLLILHERGVSALSRHVVNLRIRELSEAIKLIDEGLGYQMPTHQEAKHG